MTQVTERSAAFYQGAPRRLATMVLRYWYLIKGSWPRIVDLMYWPMVQMTLWGFIQTFLIQQSNYFAQAFGILLGGVLLWDVLFRGQIGLTVAFLEEIWSRNLGHLLVTPLRPVEFVSALMVTSLIKVFIGLVPTTFLAIWFFGFSIYSLGLGLVFFFLNLIIFGWSIGLMVSGIVLRYGQGAESLAWAIIFVLAPLCGVYYPVSILPDWIQVASSILPPSYIFDGMRSILIDNTLRWDLIVKASLMTAAYLVAGVAAFLWWLRQARQRGMLLQIGE